MKKFLLLLREYINGDFAYKNYLAHHKQHHANQEPLNKKAFLQNKEKQKWNKINRCC
jgi:uncharacterized short protein YbdD (DUF466 family)